MATLHRATLRPSKVELLTGWLPDQRWFSRHDRPARLTSIGAYRFDDPDGEVGIEVLLLRDTEGDHPTLYQVPVTYRAEPREDLADALIGTLQHSVLGMRYVYDGCHDPVFATALLHCILTGGRQAELTLAGDGTHAEQTVAPNVTVHGSGSGPDLPVASCRVLRGEQSNTSMVYSTGTEATPGSPVIVKLFRVLHQGDNPDVVLQTALSDAGSHRVPRTYGHLSGAWQADSHSHHGHLAFAQEFLPGVQDAWHAARSAARAGTDFAQPARRLGAATAQLHRDLAAALGSRPATDRDVTTLTNTIRARFDRACRADPGLEDHRLAFERLCQAAAQAEWPDLQRIHGDYHLGQVLNVPQRGWVMLDFEGEPLRPLADRSQLEPALRDVAGMLRSLDYAAGSVEHAGDGDRSDWSRRAAAAFLDGYASDGVHAHRALLQLLVVDKACYELVYEVRHRPDWAPIPRRALERLLGEQQPSPAAAGPQPVDRRELDALLAGRHAAPHGILGPHTEGDQVVVRVLRPLAGTVQVLLPDGSRRSLEHEYEGLWSGVVADGDVPDYRVITTYDDGIEHLSDDPYRFLPTLGPMDLHLIGEGRHEQLWTVLGARHHRYPGAIGDVDGVAFAVWAPHARGVRATGDFNHWDGSRHPMRRLDGGVWELFVPDVWQGCRYKYEILCSDGVWRAKADPLARESETAPKTASIVTESHYDWGDQDWMTQRAEHDVHQGPMSVYEVHLGSWRQGLGYRDLADQLVDYVKDLGFTHVELMPVMQHPYPPSWGYHVTGYYAPNPRLGSPDDLRFLIDTLHRNGIGVLLDWVPGHFATDEWALARFDGEACYEHPDPRRGWHPEWGSYIFDFGRNQVRNFLVANAVYWLQEYHADGLRVDGVASMLYLDYSRGPGQWLPNRHGGRENLEAVRLLQETNATSYRRCPGTVMIAEESTSWPGVTKPTSADGLGFGFKWNMGWMHDTLGYLENPPIYRQYHHNQITFALIYAWSEQFVLPISHDEVVHGKGSLLRKMPGDRWQQLANVRALLGSMWAHPGKQLIFMGTEFAQESEWADGRQLDWWLLDQPAHLGVHRLVRDLNAGYARHPALWALDNDPAGFSWIDADAAGANTFTSLRYDGQGDIVAVLTNYSGTQHDGVQVGLPRPGRWREVLNTDADVYGGSGSGNLGSVTARADPVSGQPYSARVVLPALSTIWLVPDAGPPVTDAREAQDEPASTSHTDEDDDD